MGKHFIGAPTSPRGEESRLFCSLSAVVSQIWNFCPGYMCVYSRLYTTHTHWKTGNQNLSDVFPPLTETLGDTPPPHLLPLWAPVTAFRQHRQHSTPLRQWSTPFRQYSISIKQYSTPFRQYSISIKQYSTPVRQVQQTTQALQNTTRAVQHTQAGAAHHLGSTARFSGRCSTLLRQVQHTT